MSRYCGEVNVEPILQAASLWRSQALQTDHSVFSTKSLWSLRNFQALDEYYVNKPDEGERTFLQKLEAQLAPTGLEVKQLAAEMLWVILLCPMNITAAKKRQDIKTVWEWSGEPLLWSAEIASANN